MGIGAAIPAAPTTRADTPAPATATVKYELPPIPDEFKDADAVILSWDQKWTVAPDGAITQHETKRVLIRNDRAIGAFADPRITYNKDWQTVKVLVARTITPDGRAMDVPEYSRNTVAPGESAGWPAFAAIQQLVLTYSAIEPGAILELEWERVTKPGMKKGITKSDLQIAERIAVDYPTLSRTIQIDGSAGAWNTPKEWKNVAADRDEPQSVPAFERVEHFCFNSDTSSSYLPMETPRLDALVVSFGDVTKKKVAADVAKWLNGKLDAMAKAREVHSQFSKLFNIVNVNDEYVPDPIRRLDDIYASRYGSHREATALLLALMKEAGLKVEPYLVTARLGDEKEGQSSIVNYGVILDADPEPSCWTAGHGRVHEPFSCRNQMIVTNLVTSASVTKYLNTVKFAEDASTISLTGSLTIDADFKWTGQIDLACTGVFSDSPACGSEDQRKEFVRSIVERVLPKCTVESTTIASLSDENAKISAKLKSADPLPAVGDHRMFALAAAGAYGRSVGIPLASSIRRTDLRLASRFTDSVSLTIELPKCATGIVLPPKVERKIGDFGDVRQKSTLDGNRLTFDRTVRVDKRDVPAADFAALRAALSEVQTDSARSIIWKCPTDAAQKVN